ncbi:hypothetical protein GH714_018102 [Hevea brasiliensis]|uniref:Aspergillus nuclease S1 n=1 Tax=Hevea brasiliensis TaxID=3981 RepID=A0A6A6LPP2_HEVBR|nr:hypothetical protein GH714_018102 [Hevea brasiliensis]
MDGNGGLLRWSSFAFVMFVGMATVLVPGALGWSKEGHIMTCRIAQNLLGPEAAHAVEHLLPHNLKGDLSALCIWPDQIRHWHKYRWTSSLHFIDTQTKTAHLIIQNFTSQLLHYREGTTDRRYNLTEALLFLSHFMGDIHQPMHVGFTSDEGGNTIELHWFRRKSNLHHVWDREIILTALKDFYENDMDLLQETIEGNFTDGIWYDDVSSWKDCDDLLSCPNKGIGGTPHYQFPNAERILEESENEYEEPRYPGLEATRPAEKPRVVVLGTGWAACRFMKGLDTKIYDVVCISPRNHMVFTPLLASTCVGTLEFRSVAEPVSRIQSALATSPNSYFYLASCTGIDTDKHEVYCETVSNGGLPQEPHQFKVAYDKLVIAAGAEPLTFGIKGVNEHAYFLREVNHAQEIRKKLLMNLMLSENPGIPEEEKNRLLHCVVIGGGPTGVEFSGELSDFIMRDVQERYSHVKDHIKVTLIEANEILSSFDVGLRQYATNHLTKCGVRLTRGVVKEVHPTKLFLSDGTEVPYGLLVWSTGVGPSQFVKSLNLPNSPGGRIGIDQWLRVPSVEDVFALGDCAGFLEQTGGQCFQL